MDYEGTFDDLRTMASRYLFRLCFGETPDTSEAREFYADLKSAMSSFYYAETPATDLVTLEY